MSNITNATLCHSASMPGGAIAIVTIASVALYLSAFFLMSTAVGHAPGVSLGGIGTQCARCFGFVREMICSLFFCCRQAVTPIDVAVTPGYPARRSAFPLGGPANSGIPMSSGGGSATLPAGVSQRGSRGRGGGGGGGFAPLGGPADTSAMDDHNEVASAAY